jgi:hypothetical protein
MGGGGVYDKQARGDTVERDMCTCTACRRKPSISCHSPPAAAPCTHPVYVRGRQASTKIHREMTCSLSARGKEAHVVRVRMKGAVPSSGGGNRAHLKVMHEAAGCGDEDVWVGG